MAALAKSPPVPLVEKYKPDNVKKIVGQQGASSNAVKLTAWLKNWYKNLDKKPAWGKFGPSDGSGLRAALLSGPPGIGKTTTAELVCKELGLPFISFNASDTRNKSSLESHIKTLLSNNTLESFSGSGKNLTARHVLIMDEVDGMAGNEDRGGVAELIQLIKKSQSPIICICNDRNHQKLRSLVNYCYDLRFYRPRMEQIKGAMLTVCHKENIKITPDALTDLITSSNQDIRQVLHYLSLLVSSKDKPTLQPGAIKDVKLNPFDALRVLFTHPSQSNKPMSFMDRSDLFFLDYSLMPLFVYENYVLIHPEDVPKSDLAKRLSLEAKACNAIAFGNLIETEIRSSNNWSLLPLQAAFSAVLPSYHLSGTVTKVEFPKLLGKISTVNKNDRLLQELKMHMSLKLSSSKAALMDIIPVLLNKIYKPLQKKGSDGVASVLDVMNYYSLRKEDLDTMLEFLWSNEKNPTADLETKTKAALTRACNSKGDLLPYSDIKGKKTTRKRTAAEMDGLSDEDTEAEQEEEEIAIKPKKVVKKASGVVAKTTKVKASPKKGTKRARSPSTKGTRGRGRGRGKK